MSTLNETTAKRIGKLVRRLGSPFENERHVALAKLGALLNEEGLGYNDIATVIENCNGEIEEYKYSDADAAAIYSRGVEKGRAERPAQEPTEFFDANGEPIWYAIAMHCRDNKTRARLDDWQMKFVEDIAYKVATREPTAKQALQLLRIFIKLGGKVEPKIMQRFFV